MFSICNNCIVFIDCDHIAILCFRLSSQCLCTGRSLVVLLITKKNSIRFSVAIKNRTKVFFVFFFLSFFFFFLCVHFLLSFRGSVVSGPLRLCGAQKIELMPKSLNQDQIVTGILWVLMRTDVFCCAPAKDYEILILKNSFNRYLSKPKKLLC